jgi:RNA polymerase sigma factor (sigma-70 family)
MECKTGWLRQNSAPLFAPSAPPRFDLTVLSIAGFVVPVKKLSGFTCGVHITLQTMEIPGPTDAELLADWLRHRREPAFHALVSRYAPLVHSAAKRICGDDALAADASQLVFILLAQKAKSLVSHPSLAGWLHVTAVMQTRNLIDKSRRESRKRQLFQSAMETDSQSHPDTSWQEIQPVLDDALNSLSENDREAILLRFYRSLSVKEIAATLGIATDAAQKRLDRATERLREKLTRRGVTTAGSLSATMLAGFSTDAQAAVISTSVLSSKAIAASAATPTSLIATLLAMKATTYVAPTVIIICGGLFLNSQSQAILKTRQETAAIRAATPEYVSVLVTNGRSNTTTAKMDWEKIARRMDADPTQTPIIEQHLLAHLKSQSREE